MMGSHYLAQVDKNVTRYYFSLAIINILSQKDYFVNT